VLPQRRRHRLTRAVAARHQQEGRVVGLEVHLLIAGVEERLALPPKDDRETVVTSRQLDGSALGTELAVPRDGTKLVAARGQLLRLEEPRHVARVEAA
jgi:hypothetical protein